jgi:CubicO group peptidase (beta-lactamase class C family)
VKVVFRQVTATIVVLIILSSLGYHCIRPSNKESLSTTSFENKLDQYLELESQQGFSGVISIKTPDNELIFRSFGYADKVKKIENSRKTVFDIGSLTKQFTGAAILKLEEEGKLSVTDSLYKFFPNIPADKKDITIHQLLTHSSGIQRRIGSDFEKLGTDVFLERVFQTPLVFIPGEQYGHSHAGYSILGVIIEKISGITYEKYLKTRFFDPLGMNSTGYVLPTWNFSNVANGYRKCRSWGKPMDLNWGPEGPYWNLKANAGLLSSAEDLMAWQNALEKGNVLKPELMKEFLSAHIKEGDAFSYYSYGWMITKSMRGTDVYAHEGGNGKFLSDWINYPEDNASILVLSNDWRPGYGNIATEIATILFYPHHEPQINLKKVECFSTFPSNVMGKRGGEFIGILNSQDTSLLREFAKNVFGDYVHKKYTEDHIIEVLKQTQSDFGNASVTQIVIIDNEVMEIEAFRESNNQKNQLQLTFDKDDSYKIRMMRYNSN